MSIQQNFPSTRPSLNLNFARSQKLDPRITFTRTSSATRVNSDGLIEVVPANSPRFDFDPISGECLGLLVEEQRQNLWNNSNDFTVWTKQTSGVGSVGIAVTNATLSPDGSANAYKYFVQESGSTFYSLYRGVAGISSNTTYTYSTFIKAAEISTAALVIFDNSRPSSAISFNLSNGSINWISSNSNSFTTISTASTITNYGNGWYRCSAVWSSVVSGNAFQFKIDLGGALSQNQGMFIYGAQLEQGAFPTSYIPTTNTTATRTQDLPSITGSNFSDFYNPNEGTVVISSSTYTDGSDYNNALTFSDGSLVNLNNTIEMALTASGLNKNVGRVTIRTDGSTVFDTGASSSVPTLQTNKKYKLASSFKKDNFNFTIDGVTDEVGVSGELPSNLNTLLIGYRIASGSRLNGYIEQLVYYPTALPSNQLITLTK